MVADAHTVEYQRESRLRFAARLLDNHNFLGLVLMLPAAAILLLFLAYPLGLGF